MKKTLFECAIVTAALLLAASQGRAQARYSATTGDVSLNSAGTTLTIQQPASNAKHVQLEAAVIYCSVACNVTQSQNGAAATATAGTANPVLPGGPSAAANIFTASNVGNGTAAGGILHIAAAQTLTVDISKVSLPAGGAGVNYSVVISSITGTASVTLFWSEQQ